MAYKLVMSKVNVFTSRDARSAAWPAEHDPLHRSICYSHGLKRLKMRNRFEKGGRFPFVTFRYSSEEAQFFLNKLAKDRDTLVSFPQCIKQSSLSLSLSLSLSFSLSLSLGQNQTQNMAALCCTSTEVGKINQTYLLL